MTLHRLLLAWGCSTVIAGAAFAQAPPPLPSPPIPDTPTATAVLTGEPGVHPKGTVTSPWCGGHPCGGPVGGNGPLTYEAVMFTGPSLPVAGGSFSGRLSVGWSVGGNVRTLWFNEPGTAAWVLDLGLSFTYNRGESTPEHRLQVFTPRPRNTAGELEGPDELVVHTIRGLSRTTLGFGIGRDYFFNGAGFVGGFDALNGRFGVDAGGRWGTSHVDLVPLNSVENNYLRRTGITHGVYIGTHLNWEVPMGSWIFTSGVRTEWEYLWTNVIPPHNGDIVSVNILLTAGIRF
jgi:hypothetical protein